MLKAAGFLQLQEIGEWDLAPLGKYFYTRNQSSLIAFTLPSTYSSTSSSPALIIASHTDSPVLKVKPVSKVEKLGFLQIGVEPYGGGLWNTWFDRDLSLAGRVMIEDSTGNYHSQLVQIKKPILRIPNLAIHLNREVNDKGFAPNKQTHILPILATNIKLQLQAPVKDSLNEGKNTVKSSDTAINTNTNTNTFSADHHSLLLSLLSSSLSLPSPSDSFIRDFELCLYDTQPAVLGGAFDEFIFSRALDNLMMSFVGIKSLIDSSSKINISNNTKDEEKKESGTRNNNANNNNTNEMIRVIGLFDNEEVGSESFAGAGSSMLRDFLLRVNNSKINEINQAIRRSFLISADMAHAVHPNYSEMHEEHHRPGIHKGLVIKSNANQRYATSMMTAFPLYEIAGRHGIPVQKFVVRNDVACGSTIGPILSANCGIRTVDVGIPQLSMHSIREMCGIDDVHSAYRLFLAVFDEFQSVDQKILVEGEQ